MGNSSCHGTEGNLLDLLSIEFIFLPPKTTFKLQPLDSEIIAALEAIIDSDK